MLARRQTGVFSKADASGRRRDRFLLLDRRGIHRSTAEHAVDCVFASFTALGALRRGEIGRDGIGDDAGSGGSRGGGSRRHFV